MPAQFRRHPPRKDLLSEQQSLRLSELVFPEACAALLTVEHVQQPIAAHVPVYESYFRLYQELYPAVKEQYAKLAALSSPI